MSFGTNACEAFQSYGNIYFILFFILFWGKRTRLKTIYVKKSQIESGKRKNEKEWRVRVYGKKEFNGNDEKRVIN